jgi:M-phase phosphoprotein-6
VEEKAKVEVQEEVVVASSGGSGSSAQVARKCIVIMEGNPHPGAVKGRMSFQNFNPSIDRPEVTVNQNQLRLVTIIKIVQTPAEGMKFQDQDLEVSTLKVQKAYL